jgi:internalin A
MQAIGEGERIFVFLSQKYLESSFCMYELYLIWITSVCDKQKFLRRVRVYSLDDVRIGGLRDCVQRAKYWEDQIRAVEAECDGNWTLLGPAGVKKLLHMQMFASHLGDILDALTDIRQPRSFEELKEYGFDDPPT